MKQYSTLQIQAWFDQIWQGWLNKGHGEHAPMKAFTVALRSGEDPKEIVKACKIYTLQNEGEDPKYIKRLNNFINEDEWKDVLACNSLERLEEQRREAVELIELWNKTCRKHWLAVSNIDDKVPMAKNALANESFRKFFKKALDKASLIFQYQFNDSDRRSSLTLSFRWFTDVRHDKHTVSKIMDGEYGKPNTREVRYKTDEWKDPTPEQREEALSNFKEIFNDIDLNDYPKSRPLQQPAFSHGERRDRASEGNRKTKSKGDPKKEKPEVSELIKGITDGIKAHEVPSGDESKRNDGADDGGLGWS